MAMLDQLWPESSDRDTPSTIQNVLILLFIIIVIIYIEGVDKLNDINQNII